MSTFPKVSCLCPTYARVHLLEEALESFLRQEYEGEKEFIICNDFSEQNLSFSHPEVKIFNLQERFATLGDKRRWLNDQATGKYIQLWDDDDLYFPRRIARMVEEQRKTGEEFIHEGTYYIMYGGEYSIVHGYPHGVPFINRELYFEMGGHRSLNQGEDVDLHDRATAFLRRKNPTRRINGPHVCCSAPQYLYRFGPTPRAHLSVFGEDREKQAGEKTGYNILNEIALAHIDEGKEPKGDYVLRPFWAKDWESEVSHLNGNSSKH